MIELYHGSNVGIATIDLCKCSPNKDFGRGFYLTDIREQAVQMAQRRTRIAGWGHPVVSAFAFDEALLRGGGLNVKLFDEPDEEWALFILANRNAASGDVAHDYDIVVGPVADDGVAYQLERYVKRIIPLDVLVRELTYKRLNRQYYFGTARAVSTLKKL